VTKTGVDKIVAVCVAAVIAIGSICATVYGVVRSNNDRALEERKLQEEARKQQALEALEVSRVRAAQEVREAEIKSKKRKIWELDAEGAGDGAGPENSGFAPGPEKF